MKRLLVVITICLIAVLAVVPTMAKGPSEQAGKSNKAHLYLYEKNPTGWTIVTNGAWGKLTYNVTGSMFEFVFNAHRLVPGADYTLMYYPDPWPGVGLKCLGQGVVNEYGDVHIANAVDTGSLPMMEADENYSDGAKIWLVKTEDVQCTGGTWNVVGKWVWNVFDTYKHDIEIKSQNSYGSFEGLGGYPSGSSPYMSDGQTTEEIEGRVYGSIIELTTKYNGPYNPGYNVTAKGTIHPDGTISGTDPWEWELIGNKALSMGGKMVGWHPAAHLFEYTLISYVKSD